MRALPVLAFRPRRLTASPPSLLAGAFAGGAGNFQPGPGIYETDAHSQTTVVHPPPTGHMAGPSRPPSPLTLALALTPSSALACTLPTGRGGAGNYIPQEHSQERGRAAGGNGDAPKGGPIEGLKNMVRSISRSRSNDRSAQ